MATRTRQIRRTRERVVTALAGLLVDIPYESITLAQIADAAGVARPSIYRLFSGKDDILAAYFAAIFTKFEADVAARQTAGLSAEEAEEWTYQALFRAMAAHRDELLNFARRETRALLIDGVWRYQERLISYASESDVVGGGDDEGRVLMPLLSQDARIVYESAGGAAVVTEWILQGMRIPPDEMASILMSAQQAFRSQAAYLPEVLAEHLRRERQGSGSGEP
ncbi:TetR/AcrR family transcriptional regulator [Acidipropionibacterium acidipropionici]|uniref:TetR/AcrR family transcriptional regulator n=1 Tax=Acidipropionibacterium acidipropionici TaxID=1748 RepID=UPI0003F7CABF|nr:TetR/AcrR family transcriptional regulator [Acidipropionibacterium acidipropionici]ALN14475.1 hypothetical protein ASQ49_03385 [Acidipropionibacterium acidipropionici]APZ09768.1 TetR family transcriptional regulator [Acidipropionibacterium acidipropionici]